MASRLNRLSGRRPPPDPAVAGAGPAVADRFLINTVVEAGGAPNTIIQNWKPEVKK